MRVATDYGYDSPRRTLRLDPSPTSRLETTRSPTDGATMEIHPELHLALAKNPGAERFFATITAANRYAIMYQEHEAKRPETRERRIEKFIAMLLRGEVPR